MQSQRDLPRSTEREAIGIVVAVEPLLNSTDHFMAPDEMARQGRFPVIYMSMVVRGRYLNTGPYCEVHFRARGNIGKWVDSRRKPQLAA
jgi:hypothetical protein